jgi:adenylate cyclase
MRRAEARPDIAANRQTQTDAGSPVKPLPAITRPMFWLAALVVAALIAINTMSWQGVFWAAWPVLGIAVLSALVWVFIQNRFDRLLAGLGVVGLGIAGINILTWNGIFWSGWPLLGIGIVAALYKILRR